MRIEALNKKFHHAYQTLVDTVEELVVKDGKNLQQAIHSAEEKLSECSGLSKVEVQEISTELKQVFQTLNVHLNDAKESFKEEFKQNTVFVTDSIWGKFLKIVDTNTVQLLAFEKNLEEQVQEIRTVEHLTNHQEHTQWNSDHELWLVEIALWKIQHAKALSKLDEIEKAINQHSNDLDEYAQVVQAHEAREHEQEEVMANAERDPSIHVLEALDGKRNAMHKQERQEHNQQTKLHRSMKKYHFGMMLLLNNLYKQALQEAV